MLPCKKKGDLQIPQILKSFASKEFISLVPTMLRHGQLHWALATSIQNGSRWKEKSIWTKERSVTWNWFEEVDRLSSNINSGSQVQEGHTAALGFFIEQHRWQGLGIRFWMAAGRKDNHQIFPINLLCFGCSLLTVGINNLWRDGQSHKLCLMRHIVRRVLYVILIL